MTQDLLESVADGVATLTMNRPDSRNALSRAMMTALAESLQRLALDPAVRVVVLTGAGRAFCAGGDVTGFKSENPRQLLDKLPRAYDFSRRPDYQSRATYFPSIPKPIIAMLNGPTAGLGLVHALFADIRFAAEEATITTAFARIGLASEYGMGWILARVVGHANALDLAMSARKIKGLEAQRLGLVQHVHPAAQLAEATYAYAREMAEQVSPRSTRVFKQQLWELPFQTLHEAVITDSDAMMAANVCEDFKEGKLAFKEKRAPKFTGR